MTQQADADTHSPAFLVEVEGPRGRFKFYMYAENKTELGKHVRALVRPEFQVTETDIFPEGL